MKPLLIPPHIKQAIDKGAVIALSLSGGKDGQAMAMAVMTYLQENNCKNEVIAVHSDLGKVEWEESLPQCEFIANWHNIKLHVVRYPGGLMARMRARLNTLAGKNIPFWPSSEGRYCTSDTKRNPINKLFRKYKFIISAEGLRASESKARAKKQVCSLRTAITSKTYKGLDDIETLNDKDRLAITWYPIHDWLDDDVWETWGSSTEELNHRRKNYQEGDLQNALEDWMFHPAYVYGNERVSCKLCVLASLNDLKNGVKHGRELAEEYAAMEDESGYTFKNGFSIKALLN